MRRLGILLWLLLLIGCRGSLEKKAVGNWQQDFDANITSGLILKTKLELSADHSFVLHLPAPTPKTPNAETAIEGTWEIQGDIVSFTSRSSGGKPLADLRRILEDNAERSKQQEISRASQDLARRQQLAAAGYIDTSPPQPAATIAPGQMILPDKAKLLEDGKKLALKFRNDASQALELVRS